MIHPEADEEHNVDAYYGKKLLGGGHKSIEAPYILYDEATDYYYLYVSYGTLTSSGGYQVRVFRSKTVDGELCGYERGIPDRGCGSSALRSEADRQLPSFRP